MGRTLRPKVEAAVAYTLRQGAEEAAVVAYTLRLAAEEAAVAACILRPEAAGANLTSDYLLMSLSRRVTQPRNCG
jgi:hypothetical protein